MRAVRTSLLGAIVVVAAIASLLAVTAPAGAKGHCYINTSSRYPTLLSPCNKATIAAGTHVVFTVRDLNSSAQRYTPALSLTKKAPKHGVVPEDTSGFGLFDELKPVKGHHGRFTDAPAQHVYAGYWDVTPGKYYIQIRQIEVGCTTPHCTVYSPVTTITIK